MIWRRVCLATVLLLAMSCGGEQISSAESPAEYAVRLAAGSDAEYLVDQLNRLEETRGSEYAITEDALIGAGYMQLMAGRIAESRVLHEAATMLFPQSARAWDNLAEVGIYLGDRDLAERCLARALELDSLSDARWRAARLDWELREAAAETDALNTFEPGAPTGLSGAYFGQTPPGVEPEVFAPGIVSTKGGHEFSCTFTPDGREFYFNRGPNIYAAYWGEAGWSAPALARFNSDRLDHEPFIPTDGRRLYFGSGRERDGLEGEASYGIWVMERSGDTWGSPEFLFKGMFVTLAESGNAYVTDINFTAGGGICVYEWKDGEYRACRRLAGGINTRDVAHPLIAPDESFLIHDGENDLFISFPLGGGAWSPGTRIDEISDIGAIMTASLSPDGQFLFFYANHDIYWVSTEVLRPYIVEFSERSPR